MTSHLSLAEGRAAAVDWVLRNIDIDEALCIAEASYLWLPATAREIASGATGPDGEHNSVIPLSALGRTELRDHGLGQIAANEHAIDRLHISAASPHPVSGQDVARTILRILGLPLPTQEA